MRTVALAAVFGLAATAVAAGVAASGNAAVTAFEWSLYQRLSARQPVGRPAIVIIRDAAGESTRGPGVRDRAMLARLVTSLSQAGAAVIGLDASLEQPSAPGRGGAASDALLSQAIALAENVVLPIALEPADTVAPAARDGAGAASPQHRSWSPLSGSSQDLPRYRPMPGSLPGFAQYAKSVGHTLAPPDADGVVRRTPLFVRVGDRRVPAYGLALAGAFKNVDHDRIPVDRHGHVLVPPTGAPRPGGDKVVELADIWSAIDARQPETLQNLVADRIVLVLVESHAGASRILFHANLLDRALSGAWLSEVSVVWTVLDTILLAALAAWLGLAARWWKAAIAITALALGYVAIAVCTVLLIGLLPALAIPLVAMAVSAAAALLWNQLGSAYRVRHLESEVTSIREGLVRQESAVEALEEDLEAARAAVARSTGGEEALRAQLAAARAQEERTRARLDELEHRVRAASAEVRQAPLGDAELERLQRDSERLGIVTRDPAMLALFRDLEKAARSVLPILIAGEPGTGKELFARAAHRLSARAEGPFVAVNMSAIPAELFESEMFGHVRGSFTGAVADRKGLFEQANRGTIFLDEVGELRPEHQSKLLRVLQDKSFYRVGATRPTTVDVRVVAASNRDLERGSAEGWFREDLYFRLKGLVLRLPPLRERPRDIPLLAARFVRDAAAEVGRPALPLSEAALAALERNDWPGNARELQNCLRQALALADGAAITVADLRLRHPGGRPRGFRR